MHTFDPRTPSADELDRLAHKRAGMRMGWLIHAVVFVGVNLLLFAMSEYSM